MIPGFYAQQAAMNAPGGGGGGDAIPFANVGLLLHFEGSHGSSAIVDSSSHGHPVTASGSVSLDTGSPAMGGASGYIPGSTSAWTIPGHSSLDLGNGAFQFDFIYTPEANLTDVGLLDTVIALVDGSSWGYEWACIVQRYYLRFYFGHRGVNNQSIRFFLPPGYDFGTLGGTAVRCSIARSAYDGTLDGGKWGAWVDGIATTDYQTGTLSPHENYGSVVTGTYADSRDLGSSIGRTLQIGRFGPFGGLALSKHVDEVRIVTGANRPIGVNYTPLATPFPDS